MKQSAWSEFNERKFEFLEFAVASAKAAGKIHMNFYNSNHDIEWTGRVHFRTEADIQVSAMLRKQLSETYPNHNIHSEEEKDHNAGSQFTWVDDELDGTIPYARRFFDGFSFSRALCIDSRPVLGVVYMPLKDFLYTGVSGEPSKLNGEKIKVNKSDSLNKVVMSLYSGKELGGKQGFRSSHLPFLAKVMEDPGIMTEVGFACASASLCFVADGRIEACLATGLGPEDMAAAVVILKGAGAKVTNLKLEPWSLGNKSILTANPIIHELLSNRLKDTATEHFTKWQVV